MATVSVYGQYYVRWNGVLLQENHQLEITLEGDDQDVFTLVKGWSGQTPSPKKVMAALTNVVPPEGQEVDAFFEAITSSKGEMRFEESNTGRTLISQGFIRKAKISGGVGKTAEQSFEFHGGPGIFQ